MQNVAGEDHGDMRGQTFRKASGTEYHDKLHACSLQIVDALLKIAQDVFLGKGDGRAVGETGYQHIVVAFRFELLDLLPGQAVQAAALQQLDLAAEDIHNIAGHVHTGGLSDGDCSDFHKIILSE